MISEYVDYLKSLNNSLIRAGIRLPLDLSEDYTTLSNSVSILEQYLFFNRVLNICDSGYKIAILSNESKETYEEILKDEFIKEFKVEFEALDSGLLKDPDDELRHSMVIDEFISNVVIKNEVYSESDSYIDDEGNPLSATEMFMKAIQIGVSENEIEDEEDDSDDDYLDEPYFIEEISSYSDGSETDIADDEEELDEDEDYDYEDAYEIDDSNEDEEDFDEDDEYVDEYDSDDEEIDETFSGSVSDESDEYNLNESDNSDEDDDDPYSFDDEDSDSEEEIDDDEYDNVYDDDSNEDDEECDDYDDTYEDESYLDKDDDPYSDEDDEDDPYSDDEYEDDLYSDENEDEDEDDPYLDDEYDEEYEDAYDSEDDDNDEYEDAYDSEDDDDVYDSEDDDEDDIDFGAYDESDDEEDEDEDDPYDEDEDNDDEYIDFDDYDEDDEVPFNGASIPLSTSNQGNITQTSNKHPNMGYKKKSDDEITADQIIVASDAIVKGTGKLFSVISKKFKESVSSESKDDTENN